MSFLLQEGVVKFLGPWVIGTFGHLWKEGRGWLQHYWASSKHTPVESWTGSRCGRECMLLLCTPHPEDPGPPSWLQSGRCKAGYQRSQSASRGSAPSSIPPAPAWRRARGNIRWQSATCYNPKIHYWCSHKIETNHVKLLLKLLIGVIYAKLLKAVDIKCFKPEEKKTVELK